MVRQPWRLDARGRRLFDVGLVALLLLPVAAFPLAGVSWAGAVLCTLQIAPLLWRRRWPLVVFGAVAVASALQLVLVDTPLWGQVAFPIATYSVARHQTLWPGLAAVGTGLVGAVLGPLDWLHGWGSLTPTSFTAYSVLIGAIVVSSWALGALNRTREGYVAALVERGVQLERDAVQRAEIAAAEERARIAREMHDVVAHGLSVIVVQADGARYAADRDPGQAAAALETIGTTGRQALAEMRQLLGLLRQGPADAPAPLPTLADLPDLLVDMRAAGMALVSDLPEPTPTVPDGVGLTAYRVVQEALTNVLKHAGASATVHVRVCREDGALAIDVVDDGRGAAARDDGHGMGIAGMRDRVGLHGGLLEAGPAAGGGFAVSARIPT